MFADQAAGLSRHLAHLALPGGDLLEYGTWYQVSEVANDVANYGAP